MKEQIAAAGTVLAFVGGLVLLVQHGVRKAVGYGPSHIPGKARVILHIDQSLAARIRIRAAETGQDMNAIVESLLRKALRDGQC